MRGCRHIPRGPLDAPNERFLPAADLGKGVAQRLESEFCFSRVGGTFLDARKATNALAGVNGEGVGVNRVCWAGFRADAAAGAGAGYDGLFDGRAHRGLGHFGKEQRESRRGQLGVGPVARGNFLSHRQPKLGRRGKIRLVGAAFRNRRVLEGESVLGNECARSDQRAVAPLRQLAQLHEACAEMHVAVHRDSDHPDPLGALPLEALHDAVGDSAAVYRRC